MKLHELLDVIGASYNDVDLRYYKLMAKVSEDEQYNVRGVWFDHEKRTISLSLTRGKRKTTAKKD